MAACLDYRALLKEELLQRRRRNERYSARAMARDIGLSPPFLSQVLNFRKSLGDDRAFRVAERLGWPPRKRRLFVGLVRVEKTGDDRLRAALRDELRFWQEPSTRFERLKQGARLTLSEWYYYALLELLELESSRSDPLWLAGKLGISPLEAQLAVARLHRVGLLEKQGRRLVPSKHFTTTGDFPSEALRAFHCRMLDRAKDAITSHPYESRDTSSITMAIDPERIPEAKERIRRFRREMMELLAAGRKRAVYHLSVQLFRLDRSLENEPDEMDPA